MAHPQPLIDPPDVTEPGRVHERAVAPEVDVAADVEMDVEVDVETMVCPTCGEPVQAAPPAYWLVADGRQAPAFSHESDRSPLCRDRAGVVAEPVEIRPQLDPEIGLGVDW